jgi:hypothetical protein
VPAGEARILGKATHVACPILLATGPMGAVVRLHHTDTKPSCSRKPGFWEGLTAIASDHGS